MRVLVTGANGFIGSNLCAALTARPDLEVRGLVRPGSDRGFIDGMERLALLAGDVTEPATLTAAVDGIDVVYHLAGYASDWGKWETFRAVNVGGTSNLLQAARRSGVRRFVHISSVSVYGFPGGRDLDEATAFTPRPDDPYITTKAEGERVAMRANGGGLEVVVVRPAGVYGRNDRTTTLKLVPALLKGRFVLVDKGVHLMAPVYIDNLTKLITLAGEVPGIGGEAFNAADDGYTSWRQFIGWMCEDLGIPPPRLSLPAFVSWPVAVAVEALAKLAGRRESPPVTKYRVRAVMRDAHYAIGRAKRLLGYAPHVSTREGVRRTITWYRDYVHAPVGQ
jgi:nucleoside-diphosphate-sugar epimerase